MKTGFIFLTSEAINSNIITLAGCLVSLVFMLVGPVFCCERTHTANGFGVWFVIDGKHALVRTLGSFCLTKSKIFLHRLACSSRKWLVIIWVFPVPSTSLRNLHLRFSVQWNRWCRVCPSHWIRPNLPAITLESCPFFSRSKIFFTVHRDTP